MSDGQDAFDDPVESESWLAKNRSEISADGKSIETFENGRLTSVRPLGKAPPPTEDEAFEQEYEKAVTELKAEESKKRVKHLDAVSLSKWASRR